MSLLLSGVSGSVVLRRAGGSGKLEGLPRKRGGRIPVGWRVSGQVGPGGADLTGNSGSDRIKTQRTKRNAPERRAW